jgi:electron transfer flavoprotein beta subunit
MHILVCVKQVPETAEAEITIDKEGKDIDKSELTFSINEWDNYAVEEALLLKERFGGSVTVVTMGSEEAEDTLRRCLAMGADEAIRLTDKAFERLDSYATATVLYQLIKDRQFDLVLTGAQAEDDSCGQVGGTLAQLLGVPQAALVTNIEIEDRIARVHRELESGLEEIVELDLPAVVTIQTGINEPRYVSIMGIRKAASKEIKVLDSSALGLEEGKEVFSSKTVVEKAFLPPIVKQTQFLDGSPEEIATKLLSILTQKELFS